MRRPRTKRTSLSYCQQGSTATTLLVRVQVATDMLLGLALTQLGLDSRCLLIGLLVLSFGSSKACLGVRITDGLVIGSLLLAVLASSGCCAAGSGRSIVMLALGRARSDGRRSL